LQAEELPEVAPIPAGEVADDARERLVRYLNDAWAVEREQVGLLQDLADATGDPDLRSELERHREVSHHQQMAIEDRVRRLGGEPGGGRGLLGQIATRVWGALQGPRDDRDEAFGALLKALGAAEFEAEMYLAVHALARAVGDGETADLAAAHLRQERDLADQLRSLVAPTAARVTRRTAAGVA
jgi:ferritin-like metal-binding protein YciE